MEKYWFFLTFVTKKRIKNQTKTKTDMPNNVIYMTQKTVRPTLTTGAHAY